MTEPADPQTVAETVAARMSGSDRAARAAGIEVSEVAPGTVTARMTVTDEMVNGYGTAHGGCVFLLADTAFAFACNSHGSTAVARSCSIEFLAPGRPGDRLVARAVERHRQGRSGIYDVTVTREADGAVLAEFRGHSRVVPPPSKEPAP